MLKDGLAKPTDSSDRLGEDDAIELEVEVRRCLFCLRAATATCFNNALIRHCALLVKAVHERSRCDNLRLWSLSRPLPLLIHSAHVVQQEHVQGVAVLSA